MLRKWVARSGSLTPAAKAQLQCRKAGCCKCHEFATTSELYFGTDQAETPSTGHSFPCPFLPFFWLFIQALQLSIC